MTEKKDEEKKKGLGWRDYVAIVMAMLTTTLLPFVIFLLILLIFLIIFIK